MKQVKYSMLLLTLFLLGSSVCHAETASAVIKKDFTKQIKKEFPIDSNGEIAIYNKYGKIDIKTWDEQRVKIEVTITVNAKDESKAEDVFDRISVDFTNTTAYVKAETSIESNSKSWWNWGSSGTEFTIDYSVLLPENSNADIVNKYGDVFAEPISGNAKFKVKYGNFRLEGIGQSLQIDLGYGNGTVVSAQNVEGNVQYGKLRIKQADDVRLETKYSKMTLEQVNDVRTVSKYDSYVITRARSLQCNGKYDNYNVESAKELTAIAKYSDYNIDQIEKKLDLDLEYGEAKISNISNSFESINLVGKYTSFKLELEEKASYTLDAQANYAGIKYPEEMKVTYEHDKGSHQEVKGNSGNSSGGGTIKARLSYGGLRID